MTTIAYKDGIIAADTASTMGNRVEGSVVKIARNEDGDLAGVTGTAVYADQFLRWFTEGELGSPPRAVFGDDCYDRAVVFRKSAPRTALFFEERGSHSIVAEFHAMGSGANFALGAMCAGTSAKMAVVIAIDLDAFTSGKVVWLAHDGTGELS